MKLLFQSGSRPGALPPLSVSGPGALCVGFRHGVPALSRTLCVGPRRSLCRAPPLSRCLCRTSAVSVSVPGALPHSLCRGPAPSVRLRRSMGQGGGSVVVPPMRSSTHAVCGTRATHSVSAFNDERKRLSQTGPLGRFRLERSRLPARALCPSTAV